MCAPNPKRARLISMYCVRVLVSRVAPFLAPLVLLNQEEEPCTTDPTPHIDIPREADPAGQEHEQADQVG